MTSVSLSIAQCACAACGNSWITSSAFVNAEGASIGAATPTYAATQWPHPLPVKTVWDYAITYPRCFRCLTAEEIAGANAPHAPQPRSVQPDDILDVPE